MSRIPGADALGFGFNILGDYDVSSVTTQIFAHQNMNAQQWTYAGTGITYEVPDNTSVFNDTSSTGSAMVFDSRQQFQSYFSTKSSAAASYGAFSGQFDLAYSQVINRDISYDLLVTQRLSTGQVAKELNGRGMLPRRAPRWDSHSVRGLLLDATAISGRWQWRRPGRAAGGPPITVVTPVIITPEMHERLRARLDETKTGHTRHDDRYMLAGRITSPCGGRMYGMTATASYYRCQYTFSSAIERCSCRTVRVESADAAVWAQVRQVLADPVRLLAMSDIELNRATAATDAGRYDLAAIDRRVARLERAAGEQLSRLLASGLDALVAQHATKALTEDLAAARAHRDRVATWQVANAERVDRSNRLWDLASRAKETLGEADMATRRRVLDLLEVRVKVTGWVQCSTCNGSGWVASGRWTGHKTFNDAGKVCPTCLRHKWIPQISIAGVVPERTGETPWISRRLVPPTRPVVRGRCESSCSAGGLDDVGW